MAPTTNQYQPDYAVPPGWVLAERLKVQRISQAEFARRCGRSSKLISQIVSGEAPVEPATALQFERVLGVDAGIWLGIESDYRLHQARERERQKIARSEQWVEQFPVGELMKRGVIPRATSIEEQVLALLSFFGVGSIEAWNARQLGGVAYRHSPSFESDSVALTTWLRLCELEAERMECADYTEGRFKEILAHIRALTATPSPAVLNEARDLCRAAGVAMTIVKPFPKTALNGASRWLHPGKAAIHLTARHLRDDQLWFSLFHEAAHLLLHSKRQTFVHETNRQPTVDEAEADRWAADFLIREPDWGRFTAVGDFTHDAVRAFAEEQGIAPGIVAGRLQHERYVPWSRLNDLKVRLEWSEDRD